MTPRIQNVIDKAMDAWGCTRRELVDTVRDTLMDLESEGYAVYWGLFTKAELDYSLELE